MNLEESKYQRYLRDNLIIQVDIIIEIFHNFLTTVSSLQGWQGSANLNKCFVALSCLKHLIENKPDLAEIRQPANGNFLQYFKFQMTNMKHNFNRVGLTHNLYHSVSPGLQTSTRRFLHFTMNIIGSNQR